MRKTYKILSVILVVLMIFSIIPITASANTYSGTCGDNLTWTFDDETGTLTISGTGNMDDYYYDSDSDSYNHPWKNYEDSIKKVVINNGVTAIGDCAFHSCTSLTSATIPDSVTTIGDWAFCYCNNLISVTIPDSVTVVGEGVFAYCWALTSIKLSNNVTILGHYFFFACNSLENIAIPNSVIKIGDFAFSCCDSLTSITIPSSVAIIDNQAFGACENLRSIVIYDSVTTIALGAFDYCPSLTDVYYSGTETQWNKILIDLDNEDLINATIHYNSVGRMASIVAECETGDIVEFGSYPQTEVTNEELLFELNQLKLNWVSYDYYTGTGNLDDGNMQPSDFMKYADVTYNGNKYRSVIFTEYRPYINSQYNNGYYTNTVYWFKYEPLQWRVLDPHEGFIMCERAIDSQAYNNTSYYSSDDGWYQDKSCTTYANDYTTSSIRNWLNDVFYNTAFTNVEKVEIQSSTIDNKSYASDYSQYDGDATYDKVFLLSYDEIKNSKYGFSSNPDCYDIARATKGSDYAESQGLSVRIENDYYGNCIWSLRTPSIGSRVACGVFPGGQIDSHCYVDYVGAGVRPALKLNPTECEHKCESVVTPPTCTEQGYTTYTCACGDSYVDNYVDALGHTSADAVEENYIAPTCTENGSKDVVVYCSVCDEELSRETVVIDATGHMDNDDDGYCDMDSEVLDPTIDCECNCHKSGITKFFFNFALFFQKLFGSNKTCACGVAHY